MPDRDAVWGEVVEIIRETFMAPKADVRDTTVAADIDGWDSISHTYLILALEERFDIRFPDEKIPCLANVGELHRLICDLAGVP